MAHVVPLRGLRYDGRRVDLARVLAPPYDVISEAQQAALVARDPHNIVRVDFGPDEPGDRPGVVDRYTRARDRLATWRAEGVLVADERPAIYVHDHLATVGGERRRRRGIFARVAARPWEESDLRPHERTLRAPKEDRLALLRATRTHTSAVFGFWHGAAGIAEALEQATTATAPVVSGVVVDALAGTTDGPEEHTLWVVDDPVATAALTEALAPARLYVADGHHRYETAVAYARERRAAEPDAPADADFGFVLVYLCAADDPGLAVLPTHRLLRPAPDLPDSLAGLRQQLSTAVVLEPTADLAAALRIAGDLRPRHHAFAVCARDGTAVLHLPRRDERAYPSPRARLDVTVLEEVVLGGVLGLDQDRIAGGALAYTRSAEEAARAVQEGAAALAFCLSGASAAEILAVADAGETMPQKSTYVVPKVPTGLVLAPA